MQFQEIKIVNPRHAERILLAIYSTLKTLQNEHLERLKTEIQFLPVSQSCVVLFYSASLFYARTNWLNTISYLADGVTFDSNGQQHVITLLFQDVFISIKNGG